MNSIYNTIFSSLYGDKSPKVRFSFLHGHLDGGMPRGKDALGPASPGVGTWAAQSDSLLDVQSKTLSYHRNQMSVGGYVNKAGHQARMALHTGIDTMVGTQTIGFVYDRYTMQSLAGHRNIAFGHDNPLVGVKSLVHEAFPNLGAASTSQKDVAQALGFDGLNKPEQLQAIVGKAYEAKGSAWFADFLSREGVRDLPGVEYGLYNKLDPHNIGKYMPGLDNANYVPKGIKGSTAGRALHVSGHHLSDEFLSRINKAFGRQYHDLFSEFAGSILQRAEYAGGDPNHVAFLLTDSNRLYIGRTGQASRYSALPTSTEGGIFGRQGNSHFTLRKVMHNGKAVNPIQAMFEEGVRGFHEYGSQGHNVGDSIYKGMRNMGMAKIGDFHSFNAMETDGASSWKYSASSQGDFDFFKGTFDRYSVIASIDSKTPYIEELNKAMRASGKSGPMGEYAGNLERGALQTLERYNSIATQADMGMYPTIGPGHGGTVAFSGMRGFFLPGSFTSRHFNKGVYNIRNRKSIYKKSQVDNLISSRKKLGLGRTTPMGMMAADIDSNDLLSKHYSSLAGSKRTATSIFGGTVAVYDGNNAALTELFGDAGAVTGNTGAFHRQRPVGSTSAELTKHETGRLFDLISGHGTMKSWDKARQDVMGGGSHSNFDRGMLITNEARMAVNDEFGEKGFHIPFNAKYLGSASYNHGGDQSVKFSFLSGTSEAAGVDSIFVQDSRMSTRRIDPTLSRSTFGSIGDVADLITHADNWSSIDQAKADFTHRLGLLGTEKGRIAGGAKEFLKRYKAAGGVGLELMETGLFGIDANAIKASSKWILEDFQSVSEEVLRTMGFGLSTLLGDPFKVAAAMGKTLKTNKDGSLFGSVSNIGRPKLLINALSYRADELDGLLGGKGGFATKLETLNSVVVSMATRFKGIGMTHHGQHPGIAAMISDFEHSTKVKLSKTKSGIGAVGKGNFVKKLPSSITNFYVPLTKEFKKSVIGVHKYNGLDILTREQARRQFIAEDGLTTNRLDTRGISRTEINRTKILNYGRDGFFLDMGEEILLPNSAAKAVGKGMNEASHMSRYLYVPAGETLKTLMGNMHQGRDTLLYNIVDLIEEGGIYDENRVGRRSKREVFGSLWRETARMGSKKGPLGTKLLKGHARGGLNARLIQRFMDPDTALKRITNGKDGIKGAYRVGVSMEALDQAARTLKGVTAEDLKSLMDKGDLYGSVKPRPVHGSGHISMVQIFLDDSLKGGGVNISMDPFAAFMLNRDFDMDTLEMQIKESWRQGDSNIIHPAKIIAEQERMAHGEWRRYVDGLAAAGEAKKAMIAEDPKGLAKAAMSYFGFSNAPAIGFMQGYERLAFGSILTERGGTPGSIARNLDNAAGRTKGESFSAGAVSDHLKVLNNAVHGLDATDLFGEAWMLERNIRQAPITKGTGVLGSLFNDFLEIPNGIREMIGKGIKDESEHIRYAVDKAEVFLLELQAEGKLMIDPGRLANISDEAKRVRAAAVVLGTFQGVSSRAGIRHFVDGAFPNQLHRAIGTTTGALSKIGDWMFGGDDFIPQHNETFIEKKLDDFLDPPGSTLGSQQQSAQAAINNAAGADVDPGDVPGGKSEMLGKAKSFLTTHWKKGAAIFGGIVALKTISALLTDEPDDLSPAPLPRNPMVGMQHAEFNPVALDVPSVYTRPISHSYSANSTRQGSSQEIGNMVDAFAMNTAAIGGSFSNINIRDHRTALNGFQVGRQARVNDMSDFTTEDSYYA
jgi:hypothetical protein